MTLELDDTTRPALRVLPAEGDTKAVVLVLHGGAEWGASRIRPWSQAYLRMVQIGRAVHQTGRRHGVEVCLLRNRVRGWNRPDLHPVQDARWALAEIQARHGELPVLLIGHSMGGRVALRVADDERVAGVGVLAPWTTEKDWVRPVTGRRLLIVHGTQDRITPAQSSLEFAERAREVATVLRVELPGEGHAMLRRAGMWTRLVRAFVADMLQLPERDDVLARAWGLPDHERLRVEV